MLPYRPPKPIRKRSKPKANGATTANATAAAAGTTAPPLHNTSFPQALHSDLLTMRADFLQDLADKSPSSSSPMVGGDAFGVCKSIFRQRRVAAWHSRFLPPRCDPHAWGQLIYAAVLALLPLQEQQQQQQESSESTNTVEESSSTLSNNGHDDAVTPSTTPSSANQPPTLQQQQRGTLAEAAFAIFALYILHETNPLPRGDKIKGYQLITMGIRNRENSHMLYRRSFRPWIRVDQARFASLLHWREEARAQSANPSSSLLDRCLADDVLTVLENLWNELDFVSYTGVRGLEALSFHPEYPYKTNETTSETTTGETEAMNGTQGVNLSENNEEESNEASMPVFQEKVQEYLTACRAIRIPPPVDERHRRRLEHVRTALAPVFNDIPGLNIEALLSTLHDTQSATTVLLSRPRMVTFSVYESVMTSRKDDPTAGGGSNAESNNGTLDNQNEGQESYELVLPAGTPAPLRLSLESAVESLLEGDSMALMGSLLPTVSVPANDAHHDDGVSTLAPPTSVATGFSDLGADHRLDDTSTTPSTRSHAGRDALAHLLDETRKMPATRKRGRPKAASSVANAKSNAGQDALQALLELVNTETKRPRRGRPAASSSASVQSNAGQEALKALLEQAVSQWTEQSAASASVSTEQSNAGREALQALLRQVNAASPVSKRPKRSTARYSGASVQSNAGHEALKALLEQVDAAASQSGDQSQAQSSVASTQSRAGQNALDLLLRQVRDAVEEANNGDQTLGSRAITKAAKANKTSKSQPAPAVESPEYAQRGTSFLLDQSDALVGDTAAPMPEPDDLSDFSGDEQDDFSVAMSSMGRRAMQELLDSAEGPPKKPAANRKKKPPPPPKLPMKSEEKPASTRKRGAQSASRKGSSTSVNDERSTAGNDALKELLSKATTSKKKK